MKTIHFLHIAVFLLLPFVGSTQTNTIHIKAELDTINHRIQIQQKIVYFNNSNVELDKIYLHNWSNSFKGNETPLGKRFIEDYKKDFYFSKEKEKGYTIIKSIKTGESNLVFKELPDQEDILEVQLSKKLQPKDQIEINANYSIKPPNSKFTGYGKTKSGYHLRFWYLTPAVFNGEWQLMSNLNMDDLYEGAADFIVEINIPKNLHLESNLYQYQTEKEDQTSYYLVGKKKKDIILSINKQNNFTTFKTKSSQVKTDIFDKRIALTDANKIVERQIKFIEEFTGKHPHTEILVDRNTVGKNSLRDLYGIPNWLKPYPENFKWETRFFKALSSKYIDDVLLLDKRKDYWLSNGIQTFLLIEYIRKYYPDITVFGRFSKLWGFKKYNLAKLKQSEKQAFLYQLSARRFFDQSLNTSADSLSNFNRKVISQYKAGLGFKYLQDYLGDEVLKQSFREFYNLYQLKLTNSESFKNILEKKTDKDLQWFFGDYIQTSKKIDYKIKKVDYIKEEDSIAITIRNKRNITAPVSLYAVKDKEIKYKTWITGVDSTKTIKIKAADYDKFALNYEQIYPEYNSLNNFKNINNSVISKPIQFRFLRDVEDPYYNQVFFNPNVKYNLYDGVILGVNFNNKPIIRHNFEFSVTPNYAFKSKNLTGSFSVAYEDFFENEKSKIYKIRYGIGGSNFHYAPELSYNTFVPFVNIQFRRNTLRDVGAQFLLSRVIYVNRELDPSEVVDDRDKYAILNFRYIYSKPDVIRRFQYAVNAETSKEFTKLSTDIRFLKFFNEHQTYTLRFFGGLFLTNSTDDDYFNFGLNQSSDYLFEQNLFGRSERSGLFSQQYITSDGGFRSFYNQPSFANKMIASVNTSVSIWKWIEVYNDVAMLKSSNQSPRYFYENGFRVNFIPNIFEFYFPVYTNEGLQVTKEAYPNQIRFVITSSLDRIYNFIRRGLL